MALASAAVVALALGAGSGAAVRGLADDGAGAGASADATTATELGPVTIDLPDDVGPWVPADDGDLVVLAVSGPRDAFASGSLEKAFRTARVA